MIKIVNEKFNWAFEKAVEKNKRDNSIEISININKMFYKARPRNIDSMLKTFNEPTTRKRIFFLRFVQNVQINKHSIRTHTHNKFIRNGGWTVYDTTYVPWHCMPSISEQSLMWMEWTYTKNRWFLSPLHPAMEQPFRSPTKKSNNSANFGKSIFRMKSLRQGQ